MKKLVTSYTFDASAKTVTSTDFTSLEGVLLITNVTDNVIIYNFANASLGGSLSGNILTLDYDTTSMDDTDDLQIFYDDGTTALSESDFDTKTGSLTETAPGTDTASSGLNGRLQRIAQRITSLITALGSPFQAGGSIGNTSFGATQSGTWNITNVSGTVSLPTGASTLAEQQTQTASLSVLDDWDESDRAKVNPIAGQAGVQGGSGVVSATTQRVVLATDVALPAGTNAIGKLAANSGVDIGDVDVTSIAAGDNTVGRVKITDGTTVATVRELGTNDAMNVAIVDGSGNQITSFGGGTQYAEDAALGSTPTGTLAMARRKDTLATLTPVADDAVSIRTNARGAQWVELDTTNTPPVQGNVAHDAVDSGNPVSNGFYAKNYGSLPTAVADADRVRGIADRYGCQFVIPSSPYKRAYTAGYSGAQTNVAMITVAANEAVRVWGVNVDVDYDATAVVEVRIGFGTSTIGTNDGVLFETGGMVGGMARYVDVGGVAGASNEDLRITCTSPANGFIYVTVYYDIIAI